MKIYSYILKIGDEVTVQISEPWKLSEIYCNKNLCFIITNISKNENDSKVLELSLKSRNDKTLEKIFATCRYVGSDFVTDEVNSQIMCNFSSKNVLAGSTRKNSEEIRFIGGLSLQLA